MLKVKFYILFTLSHIGCPYTCSLRCVKGNPFEFWLGLLVCPVQRHMKYMLLPTTSSICIVMVHTMNLVKSSLLSPLQVQTGKIPFSLGDFSAFSSVLH